MENKNDKILVLTYQINLDFIKKIIILIISFHIKLWKQINSIIIIYIIGLEVITLINLL